jgi:hypothetical protein
MIVKLLAYMIVFGVWSFVGIRSLLSKEQKKSSVVYGCLMVISIVIGSLLIAKVNIPSLVYPYEIVFEPIGKIILKQ